MFTNNENFEGYSIQSLDIDRTDALELQLKSFVKYIKTGDIGTLCSANDGAIALSYVEGVE